MVKRKLSRKSAPVPRATSALSKDGGIRKDALPMHRGRKKRLEVRQRLEKKKGFIASEIEKLHREAERRRAELRRSSAKKGPLGPALAVMSEMAAALPGGDGADDGAESGDEKRGRRKKKKGGGTDETEKKEKKIVRHKERRRIVGQETEQVKSVREHAVFKEDPMEALRQHLMNTVAGDPTAVPPALGAGDKGASKKAGKKAGKKDGAGKRGRSELGLGKGVAERVQEEARERVAAKREEKAAYAEAASKMKRRKGGKIEKQSLRGVIARPRGRIGVKRPKI